MPLVFACIAPHGSIAIPEAKPKDRPTLASATTAGMQELGRRFSAAEPDVSIVLTPHNVHVEGAMAVIDAAAVSGDLGQWGSPIALRVPVAVVAPARDLSDDVHVRAGEAIGRAAAASRKRVALIASCDHGHGHDAKGPYGFTPKSKEFDEAVVSLIRDGDGLRFSRLGSAFAREAKADSYWQMLMLEGALGHDGWKGELLSYEAPTYFGMLCAAYAQQAG